MDFADLTENKAVDIRSIIIFLSDLPTNVHFSDNAFLLDNAGRGECYINDLMNVWKVA